MSARLRLDATPLDLTLEHPFGIARGCRRTTANVLVRLSGGGCQGWGEGAPNPRYGEEQGRALRWLRQLGEIEAVDDLVQLTGLIERLASSEERSAAAALETALCDWLARARGRPLREVLGVPRRSGPVTSYTIGIDEPAAMAAKARAAARFPLLKIKLGTPHDEALIAHVRGATNSRLQVDANEGWRDVETAARRIEQLARHGVELVEQPLPAGMLKQTAWLRRRSPLPLFADEDCALCRDVGDLADAYDGINVKLDTCGGITRGRALAAAARAAGMKVMVGCMVASSLALTAAAHVAVDADRADLDGHLLLADDPFRGLTLDAQARVVLPEGVGLGCEPRAGG